MSPTPTVNFKVCSKKQGENCLVWGPKSGGMEEERHSELRDAGDSSGVVQITRPTLSRFAGVFGSVGSPI